MSTSQEFDNALARLDEDLNELESLSSQLREVKAFTEKTKELGEKFNKHIEECANLVEEGTDSLNKFITENGESIKALTESHQSLAGRVKDMEDKVTVLNTKTEAMSKEIGAKINQAQKNLGNLIQNHVKHSEKLHKEVIEKTDANKKWLIYLMIPVILMLIAVCVLLYSGI